MPISVKCIDCGTSLAVPDGLAGKSTKCSQCGHLISIPESVLVVDDVNNEETVKTASAEKDAVPSDEFLLVEPVELVEVKFVNSNEPSSNNWAVDRRRCPVCAEMIATSAAKCRFCGEVFDERAKKFSNHGRGQVSRTNDADYTLLQSFRLHSHLTGAFLFVVSAFWMAPALLALFAYAIFNFPKPGPEEPANPSESFSLMEYGFLFVGVGSLIFAVSWFVLGIFVCRKHLWASYVVAGLSLMTMFTFLRENPYITGILGAVATMVESVVILRKGGELQRRSIPLNCQPRSLS